MPTPSKPETGALEREIRTFTPLECRTDGESAKVSGYAAVFNQPTNICDMWMEQIAPGAFTDTLATRGKKGASADVVFNVNHGGQPLARTRSGTLTLSQDDHGLKIETTLNLADPDHVRVYEKLKRGDLDKMSFAFRATSQQWVDGAEADDLPIRTIQAVELFDVCVATDGAYDGTDIGLRSLNAHREAVRPSETRSPALSRLRMKHAQFLRRAQG